MTDLVAGPYRLHSRTRGQPDQLTRARIVLCQPPYASR